MLQDNSAPGVPQGMDAFGAWFSEVFRLWSARWQVWTLQGLIVTGSTVVIALAVGITTGILVGMRYDGGVGFLTGELVTIYGGYFLLGLLLVLFGPGMVHTALKQLRGAEITVGDLFAGLRFFAGSLYIAIVTALGFLLCCVGVYITNGLLFLALPLLVDRNERATDAVPLSWRTTSQNFWLYILFTFIMALLAGIGSSFCIIGLCVTLPWFYIAQAVVYTRTFHGPAVGAVPTPGPSGIMPPPPYIPPSDPAPPQA